MTADFLVRTRQRFRKASATEIHFVFWFLAVVLGLIQAWSGRDSMTSDGVSLLDIGDAVWRGEWRSVINGYYFPLYPSLLGFAMGVVKPAANWEFFVAHIANLAALVLALAAFRYLLSSIQSISGESSGSGSGVLRVSAPAFLCLGYIVFLWVSLDLIGVTMTNPDLLLSAALYGIAAILIRLRRSGRSRERALVLGLLLGIGYLTKPVMFPLAFVFLVVAALTGSEFRTGVRVAGLAMLVFSIVALPYVLALSKQRGHFTVGEAGRVVYAHLVDGLPRRHWYGVSASAGEPLHKTRQLTEKPASFEFAWPDRRTYAVWYDPSWWLEGVKVRFDVQRQLRAVWANLGASVGYLFGLSGAFLWGAIVLAFLAEWRRVQWVHILDGLSIAVPAAAAVAMYTAVHVEQRYVGALIALLYLGFLIVLPLEPGVVQKRVVWAVVTVMLVGFLTPWGPGSSARHYSSVLDLVRSSPVAAGGDWYRIARAIEQQGVRPGERVATLENSNRYHTRWARLAKVQICCEVDWIQRLGEGEEDFWTATPAQQAAVLRAFAGAGAVIAVSSRVPPPTFLESWRRLADTSYFARDLRTPTAKE